MSGHAFGSIDALTLGLLGDGAAGIMKKRVNFFKTDRIKLMTNNNDNEDIG